MPASTFDNSIFTSSSDAALSNADWSPTAIGEHASDNSQPSTGRKKPIRKQEVAEVTAQLAVMSKSGVDIGSALESLARQCQRPALAEVLTSVRESVMVGSSFSDALSHHPSVFEANFVATVAAGEASGRMAEVLQQLSRMQQNEIRRRREFRAMLTYPVLLLLVSSSVLGGLVLFVLPRFTTIFDQYEMPLPVLTQFFLAIAGELRTRWWLWGPLAISCLVGFLAWRKSTNGRTSLDRFWLLGPLVGPVCQGMCIGRMCRMLGLMLENGVTLLESLRLTQQALNNTLYKKFIHNLETAVVNGQGLTNVLQQSEVVPASAKEMLTTAESTGNLSEVTNLLASYYEEESEAKLKQLVSILEPAITVVMGGVVAVVVLSVMLPVFNLSTFAGGGH